MLKATIASVLALTAALSVAGCNGKPQEAAKSGAAPATFVIFDRDYVARVRRERGVSGLLSHVSSTTLPERGEARQRVRGPRGDSPGVSRAFDFAKRNGESGVSLDDFTQKFQPQRKWQKNLVFERSLMGGHKKNLIEIELFQRV